jgi:indolepyruvate ferredoxin oxidoreductase beta subunit
MANIFNLLIVGLGGQGVISLGNLLREYGLNHPSIVNVVGTETRGVAQRGGSVISTVRYLHEPSDKTLEENFTYEDLTSPIIQINDAHLVIGIEPLETLRNIKYISKKSVLILNTHRHFPKNLLRKNGQSDKFYPDTDALLSMLKEHSGRIFSEDFHKLTQDELKNPIYSNIIMLGRCIKEFPALFDKKEMISLLTQKIGEFEKNKLAFEIGYALI